MTNPIKTQGGKAMCGLVEHLHKLQCLAAKYLPGEIDKD